MEGGPYQDVNNPLGITPQEVVANTPVVPNTQNPQSLTGIIDQANVQQQQNLGINPLEQQYINQQNAAMQQPTEIGPQGMNALMPGLSQPINVGSYSGSIVGNNPIFVPSGNIYAGDVELAKRQKEEEARINANKLKAAEGGSFKRIKTPQMDDKFFQANINKESDNIQSQFFKEAQDVYGEDWKKVIDNPQMYDVGQKYIQKMDGLELIASQSNQMTTVLAEIQDNIDDGTKVYSDETLDAFARYKNLEAEFQGGNSDALIGMRQVLTELEGGKSIDEYLNKKGTIKDITGAILGGTSISNEKDIPDYATLSTSDKTIYDNNIKNLVEGWIGENGEFRSELKKGLVSKESLETRLKGYLQNKVVRDKTITKTGDTGGRGKAKPENLNEFVGKGNQQQYKFQDGKSYTVTSDNQVKLPATKGTVSAAGLSTFDKDGNAVLIEGIKPLKIVSLERLSKKDPNSKFKQHLYDGIYAVAEYEQEVPLIEYDPYTGKKVDSGEMKTEIVQIPIIADERFEKAMKTDESTLGLGEGFTEAAFKELKGSVNEAESYGL